MTESPTIRPGDIAGWPKLTMFYESDREKISALLPPGITPGARPHVQVGIYCVPVKGEPEYGVSTKVAADFNGVEGWYSLGMGIDQESAIFISAELNGQPKFPCSTRYFRLGDHVEAKCTHQGYTFLEFEGEVSGTEDPTGEDRTENEWWTKYSRAVGGLNQQYDYPPHVVHVATTSEVIHTEVLDGELKFRDSPWDPYTDLLPNLKTISTKLVTSRHKARLITNGGPLDPIAFWPFADVIGGSRWPGDRGGPRP